MKLLTEVFDLSEIEIVFRALHVTHQRDLKDIGEFLQHLPGANFPADIHGVEKSLR